nr:MAG TPA: hypothetical protein [Microviridae sp.]
MNKIAFGRRLCIYNKKVSYLDFFEKRAKKQTN